MDLVWNLSTTEDGKVEMELRPSSFVCPLAPDLSQEIRHGLREIEGVKSIRVEVADCLRADEINEAFREEETQE